MGAGQEAATHTNAAPVPAAAAERRKYWGGQKTWAEMGGGGEGGRLPAPGPGMAPPQNFSRNFLVKLARFRSVNQSIMYF